LTKNSLVVYDENKNLKNIRPILSYLPCGCNRSTRIFQTQRVIGQFGPQKLTCKWYLNQWNGLSRGHECDNLTENKLQLEKHSESADLRQAYSPFKAMLKKILK